MRAVASFKPEGTGPLDRNPKILSCPLWGELAASSFEYMPCQTWMNGLPQTDRCVVVVHGYKVTPAEAAKTCEQINNLAGRFDWNPPVFIPFLWGSRGQFWAYLHDKKPSKESGTAFALAIHELTRHFRQVSLVCHSMGNRVAKYGFLEMGNILEEHHSRVDHTFMVAADIPRNDLRVDGEAEIIARLSNQVHVVSARDDKALEASPFINSFKDGIVDRLGRYGPPEHHGLGNVHTFKAGTVNERYDHEFGHSYFVDDPIYGSISPVLTYVFRAINGQQAIPFSPVGYRL